MKLRKWFTLIELIIVIIIIGILMYWLIPKYSFWNLFKETSLKVKTYWQSLVNIWNVDWNLSNFTTEVFWNTNWTTELWTNDFFKLVNTNLNADTTEPNYKQNWKNMLDGLEDILKNACSKIQVKYFPDSATYLTTSLWKDKKLNVYTTNDNVDWIDLICSMKKEINWYKKFHIIWFSDNITIINKKWENKDVNYLTLISN